MANRYGRNQKRRARLEIAQLKHQSGAYSRQLIHAKEDIRRLAKESAERLALLEELQERLVKVLGPRNGVALAPTIIAGDSQPFPEVALVHKELETTRGPSDYEASQITEQYRQNLYCLTTRIEHDPYECANMIRFQEDNHRLGTSALKVSDIQLAHVGLSSEDKMVFVKQIFAALFNHAENHWLKPSGMSLQELQRAKDALVREGFGPEPTQPPELGPAVQAAVKVALAKKKPRSQ